MKSPWEIFSSSSCCCCCCCCLLCFTCLMLSWNAYYVWATSIMRVCFSNLNLCKCFWSSKLIFFLILHEKSTFLIRKRVIFFFPIWFCQSFFLKKICTYVFYCYKLSLAFHWMLFFQFGSQIEEKMRSSVSWKKGTEEQLLDNRHTSYCFWKHKLLLFFLCHYIVLLEIKHTFLCGRKCKAKWVLLFWLFLNSVAKSCFHAAAVPIVWESWAFNTTNVGCFYVIKLGSINLFFFQFLSTCMYLSIFLFISTFFSSWID